MPVSEIGSSPLPTKNRYVEIPPLVVDDEEIIPAFLIEKKITRYGSSVMDAYKTAPTLAQLRHAFETSEEIRGSILYNRYRGEWTATFLRDGKEAVERPDEVIYENGLWIAKGGVVKTFEHFPEGRLPGNGCSLEYDKPTGFSSRTGSLEEVNKVSVIYSSNFRVNRNGLRTVWRWFSGFVESGIHDGPFALRASWLPDARPDDVGYRSVFQGSLESYRGKLSLSEEDKRGELSIATAKPGQVSLT